MLCRRLTLATLIGDVCREHGNGLQPQQVGQRFELVQRILPMVAEKRVAIVKDCLGDLDELTKALDTEPQAYFYRLRELGAMLLGNDPQS